jgi:hypothetical protein
MKTWSVVAALGLAAGLGWAQAGKPINTSCPVKGTPVNPSITATYKGKTIGFC